MFSLFICITLDGWIEVFDTLRESNFALASAYFVIFILIGAFILINLVVAVVVTNLVRGRGNRVKLGYVGGYWL